MHRTTALATVLFAALAAAAAAQDDPGMSFFVTSANPGDGGNLGGLEGADAHCTTLAQAAGVTGRTWAAYLSTSDTDARDRIGDGPWHNAEGVEVAGDVESLHGENNISKETALNESGAPVNGRGDEPNRHDILTGSMPDGTAAAETCDDWTSGGPDTAGMVGHHDRMGLDESEAAKSWNSSHPSRGGCGMEALQSTGGDGLFYCFAVD